MTTRERGQNNFDSIRLIAALMVIITHSFALLGLGDSDGLSNVTKGALQYSHLGVAVFFTISGYLITQSAMHSKSVVGYLWRRFLRIFPGLAVVLLICALLLGPLVTTLDVKGYFSNRGLYAFLGSISLYRLSPGLPGVFELNPLKHAVNGSLWTLAYEFSMYMGVLVALLAGILHKRNIILAIWCFLFVVRVYLGQNVFIYNYSTPLLLGLNMMYCLEWSLFFISGMVFYLFSDKIEYKAAFAITLLMLYGAAIYIDQNRILNYIVIPYIVFYLSFLENTFSLKNDLSYGIYIYAFPVQQSLIHFLGSDMNPYFLMLLTVFSVIPLAFCSWKLIEKPALAYKKMFV
ncbi:MAG: acyltransferase [Bacteroidetes bacterium]|nr:acyltransferase [Bacteroidota bacterium]